MKLLHLAACRSLVSLSLVTFLRASRSLRRMACLKPYLLLCNYSILQIQLQTLNKYPHSQHPHFFLPLFIGQATNCKLNLGGRLQQQMQAIIEKGQTRNETVGGAATRGNNNPDFTTDSAKAIPTLQRKISKRRQAQEERNVVLDLFKELIGKVNEGYSRVIAAQNKAALANKFTKTSKNKQRPRPKEAIVRESKERVRKSSSEEVDTLFERKEEIWNNYSKLMTYEVMAEEPESQIEPEPVPQVAETQ